MTGILENQAGQYAAGRGHLEQAVALDPNYYNARYNLGVTLLELKEFPEARLQPVSYTHLDVYKRQQLGRAAETGNGSPEKQRANRTPAHAASENGGPGFHPVPGLDPIRVVIQR